MIPTKQTIINWVKMVELKRCSAVCPCTDALQRLLVTRPRTMYEFKTLEQKIKAKELQYEMCKIRKT